MKFFFYLIIACPIVFILYCANLNFLNFNSSVSRFSSRRVFLHSISVGQFFISFYFFIGWITHCFTTKSSKENSRLPADEARAQMQTERRRDVTAFIRRRPGSPPFRNIAGGDHHRCRHSWISVVADGASPWTSIKIHN